MAHSLTMAASAGRYVDWGVIHISVANVVLIALMLVVFALALVLPFPRHHGPGGRSSR